MSYTQSLSWPNMFDPARNLVSVAEGNTSVVNRTRLLILTEPTELYNEPLFGVGLKRYLWQYNTANVKAVIQDRIKDQLRLHEPCVDPDHTVFVDGLLFTGNEGPDLDEISPNELKMTVGLQTIYEDSIQLDINLNEQQAKIFGLQGE